MLLTVSLMLGLAACGAAAPEEPAEEQETEVQEEPASAALERVEYTIEKKDHSIRDDQGNVCVEQYYDLVVVSGEGPVVDAMNQHLQEQYECYVSELTSEEEEIRGYIDMSAANGGYAFSNSVMVQETHNGNGILSLLYTSSWFMGGVANSFYTADVYDLETGGTLTAAEVLEVDEGAMTYYLKDITRRYVFENYWEITFLDYAEQTIANDYTVDSMQYYIDESGELNLCIQEYDLAPGSVNSFTIPCGLWLDSSRNRQVSDYAAELTGTPVWSSYLEAPNFFGEYRFASDGTCEIFAAYYESDVGIAWTGTWSVDDSGLLTLDLTETFDTSCTAHWEYQLVPVGQSLMLMQRSDEGLMYEKGPGYGIAMFPEDAV